MFGLLEANENGDAPEVWKLYPLEAVRQVAIWRPFARLRLFSLVDGNMPNYVFQS